MTKDLAGDGSSGNPKPEAAHSLTAAGRETQPDEAVCSSPPCLLSDRGSGSTVNAEPSPSALDESGEVDVRLWRKAKRQVLIEQRLAMPAAARTACAESITAGLTRVLADGDAALVGFYWPFKGEYDPRALVRALLDRGVRVALPVVVEKAKPLIFREWWPGVAMGQGIWNIPIPAVGDPVMPDTLLVPLVGFDRQGYRLGYGGGYYDRTLAAAAAMPRTIGIGYEMSEIKTVYPQSYDIRMDVIVTEHRTLVTHQA